MNYRSLVGLLLWAVAVENAVVPAGVMKEIDKVHIRLEGIREKCLVEELPAKTVVLVKHSASTWNLQNNGPIEAPVQILASIRGPNGQTVVRQQNKQHDRLFYTSTETGDHLFCFQPMLTQRGPNTIVKLGLEVFIGDAGDPHITSPVEAQMNDLAFHISRAVDQASDLEREQALQREREHHFRDLSEKVNKVVVRWATFQVIVLVATAIYQVHSLRRFFRAKKLV